MGHGAGRELETSGGPTRELNPELAPKLTQAMKVMDQLDPTFKESRDDERNSQMSKRWNRMVKEITDMGREIAKVLIRTHQVSLDVGVDGGGTKARPWVEETGGRFPKMYLAAEPDGSLQVLMGDETIAEGTIDQIDYEWYERMIATWLVKAVQDKRSEGGAPRGPQG